MKLFYSPGACSLACHILLHEAGAAHEAVAVSLKDGAQFQPDYLAINPKSKVPALVRDDGTVLTEVPAISYWIASNFPQAQLMPATTEGITRAIEWLNWMSGTVHNGGFTRIVRAERFVGDPLHAPAAAEKAKADTAKYLDQVEARLAGRDFALGKEYSFADPMLYVLARWVGRAGKSIEALPALAAFKARIEARPAVQASLKVEGLS
ncbi:MAG: glutathione S-transferase N-terminal domain-containing protein [Acetobacteraceae bacterium]|nr:glutathione S-transferase N-terminal domain-containing protein [Acetobacteraceae bacterium]